MREPGAAKSGRWVTINVSSGPQVSLLSSSVAVAEGADQRRDFHGRFDVRRLNNVHMIAAPKDSVATAFSGLTPPNEMARFGRPFTTTGWGTAERFGKIGTRPRKTRKQLSRYGIADGGRADFKLAVRAQVWRSSKRPGRSLDGTSQTCAACNTPPDL